MKRLMDIALALLSAPFWGPILLVLMFQVKRKLGSPVFFRQPRTGLKGETFEMMKFRTMTDERDAKGELLPDGVRLTAFGKWLRSTSLDELPELLVILKGDMSLVGPRPLLPRYLPRYSTEQMRRHEAKPGLTGWAQVNGRNAISWEEKFKLDVWYVDHQSVWLDIKIIFMTLLAVVKREGISATNDATMPEFMGSPSQESPPPPATVSTNPQPASKAFVLPAIVLGLLLAALWVFPRFWYNQTPPGNFVWLTESTNIAGWTYEEQPISKVEEVMIQADKVFCGEFKQQRQSVMMFSAKRFSNDPNEVALFAHTPDRCWLQAGWKMEPLAPDTVEVEAAGVKFLMERRVFTWRNGEKLLVYFGGLAAGRPLPYRLDHELSIAQRRKMDSSFAKGSRLRAIDKKFWGRIWQAFTERSPMLGPKQFIRIATPLTSPDLAPADERLQKMLALWLQPGDFAEDAKTFTGRKPKVEADAALESPSRN